MSYLFLLCILKEIEHLQSTLAMVGLYLYFLGLSYRNTSKALAQLPREVMLQSGNGFKDTNPRKLLEREYVYASVALSQVSLVFPSTDIQPCKNPW